MQPCVPPKRGSFEYRAYQQKLKKDRRQRRAEYREEMLRIWGKPKVYEPIHDPYEGLPGIQVIPLKDAVRMMRRAGMPIPQD